MALRSLDLMIGDWVNYRGICNRIAPADFCHLEWIDEIRPIPLTPEILEKNGFVKESCCYSKTLQYCELVDGLWIDIREENYFEGKLEYIHQLQHALRLCGIEKTIEL